jgi:hypothetical protein
VDREACSRVAASCVCSVGSRTLDCEQQVGSWQGTSGECSNTLVKLRPSHSEATDTAKEGISCLKTYICV